MSTDMSIDILNEKLKKMITDYSIMTVTEDDILAESDLINDFGYDSVQVLRLLAEIEKEFGIVFKDEDLVLEILGKFGNLRSYVGEAAGINS